VISSYHLSTISVGIFEHNTASSEHHLSTQQLAIGKMNKHDHLMLHGWTQT